MSLSDSMLLVPTAPPVSEHLNLYQALLRISRAGLRESNPAGLCLEVCRAAVESGGFILAWIGRHDAERQMIVPAGAWGDDQRSLESLKIYTDERPEFYGPTGRAFRSGNPAVCNNFLSDPIAGSWRAEAKRAGIRAAAAFPICSRNVTRGILSVYAGKAEYFQAAEMALLQQAADDLGYCLDALGREAEHRRELEAAERLAAIVESTNDAIVSTSLDGTITSWNPAAEQMFGYSVSDAIGRKVTMLMPPGRVAKELQILAEIAMGDPVTDFETNGVRKDGSQFDSAITVSPILSADGAVLGVSKVVRNIEARKQAERVLNEVRSQFEAVVENLDIGVVIHDLHGRLVRSNATARQMLGMSGPDILPADLDASFAQYEVSTLDGTPLRKEDRPIARLIRGEQLRDFDARVRRIGSASERVFSYSGTRVLGAHGETLVFVTFKDITAHQQAAQALRDANAGLEARVAERTAELALARDRAESSDRLKSAFLATMSHELRTPLNTILGFTGIVLKGMAGPLNMEQSKQLGMVQSSARHLLALINDVLDISKIEVGQLEIQSAAFDVRASVDQLLAAVSPAAEKKSLRISVLAPPQWKTLVSDQRRVEQILLNLLNNAVKFTERGEIELTVEFLEDPRSSTRFRVRDTGIGIKESDLGTLFKPFQRLDAGAPRQHEGTGLGLAICRGLADMLGGEIRVESRLGAGSIFTFTVPNAARQD